MEIANVNGVRIRYDLSGDGDVPLVLVHGSWGSHHVWDLAVARLVQSFRVLTYDRRGHGESERVDGQGSVHEDVDDVAALIEHLGLAPAYVAGNSFGASITLRLASARPDLLRGIMAHEPPLLSLLANDPPLAPMLEDVLQRNAAVVERIRSGDHAGAAEQFCETVALGPGTWVQVPPEDQQAWIEHAPTFLDEENDPESRAFDAGSITSFPHPTLLTLGNQSPPMFAAIIQQLAPALPHAETLTLSGTGHIPHQTHPDTYVETITAFVRKQQEHGHDAT